MCAQYSCFLIFGFNSNQKEHLDSLSLHSTGRQVDWHFRRSKFILRPFIGRPNCASDSAAGTLRESWYTWAGSWYIYSRQQRQVKSRQIDTRSSVYLSLFTNAGFPSIGNLRTAFFSYFSARKLTVVDFHPYTTETLTLLFTYSLFASRVKPKLM